MSIKDLFDKKKTKPVVRKNKTDIATQAESLDTAKQKRKKEDKFIPQLDFSKPENFAFYGSAEKYYSDAFKTIAGTYPYDGSEEEIIEFRNGMNYVERYIFDNLYPKTNDRIGSGHVEGFHKGQHSLRELLVNSLHPVETYRNL